MEKKLYVINDKGEVVREIENGDVLFSKTKTTIFDGRKILEYKFTKINARAFAYMNEKEILTVMTLLPHIKYETNEIYLKRGTPITKITDFMEIFNYSKRYNYIFVKRLVDDGIIGYIEYKEKKKNLKCFMFNPYIAYKGRYMAKATLIHFEKSKWRGLTNVETEKNNNVEYV